MRHFGTLFYSNYLTRAVALYRSLERYCRGEFQLIMLCMDEAALRICRQLNMPRARALAVDELERRDAELAHVKTTRSIGEYCWTCTPSLLLYLLDQVALGEAVVYLDADLTFFSDPESIFDEWGDADIAIHEHRFALRHQHFESISGVFNVGWVGIRNTSEGRRCLARWRAQCLEACAMDPARGLCGDQKYLDEWPKLYSRLAILRHPGVGVGPWNVERYQLTSVNGALYVDRMPLIFYHFHALHIVHDDFFGHIAVIPCYHYPLPPRYKKLLYGPYAGALRAAEKGVAQLPAGAVLSRNQAPLSSLARTILRSDILFARTSGRSYSPGPAIAALRLLNAVRRRLTRLSLALSPST